MFYIIASFQCSLPVSEVWDDIHSKNLYISSLDAMQTLLTKGIGKSCSFLFVELSNSSSEQVWLF